MKLINYLGRFLVTHLKLYFYFMGFWLVANVAMIITSYFIDNDLLKDIMIRSSLLALPVILVSSIYILRSLNKEPK